MSAENEPSVSGHVVPPPATLRPWILHHLNNNSIPGLEWIDKKSMRFKILWPRGSWVTEQCQIFMFTVKYYKCTHVVCVPEEWARHTGKYKEGVDTREYKRWKANFRYAIQASSDIADMKVFSGDSSGPYRVYKFLPKQIMQVKEYQPRLRPWILHHLENNTIPGFKWINKQTGKFKIPWHHPGEQGWVPEKAQIFLEWARNMGKYTECEDTREYTLWKAHLSLIFMATPSIKMVSQLYRTNRQDPCRVYQILPEQKKDIWPVRRSQPGNQPLYKVPMPVGNSRPSSGPPIGKTGIKRKQSSHEATSVQSHHCVPEHGGEIYLEIFYRGHLVKTHHITSPKGCYITNKIVPDNMLYRINSTERDVILFPAEGPFHLSDKLKFNTVLSCMQKGLLLDCKNGDINAIRHSQTIVYYSSMFSPMQKLVRNQPHFEVKTIFDIENHFKPALENYKDNKGPRPSADVYLLIGQKGTSDALTNNYLLIVIKITSCKAVSLLREVEKEKNTKRFMRPVYAKSIKRKRNENTECLQFKSGLFYLKNSDITVSIPDDTGCQLSEINISTKPVPNMTQFPEENIISKLITIEPHGAILKNHLLIKFPVSNNDKKNIQLMYHSGCSSAKESWINIKQNNTPALHKDEMFWFVNDGYCYLFSRHFSHLFMTTDSLMEPQNGIYLGASVFAKYDNAFKLTIGFHCLRCIQENGQLEKHTFGKLICDEEKMCVFEKKGPVHIETMLNERWESDNSSVIVGTDQLLNLCHLNGIYNRNIQHYPIGRVNLDERTKVLVNITQGEAGLNFNPRITMKEISVPENEDMEVVEEHIVHTPRTSSNHPKAMKIFKKSSLFDLSPLQEDRDGTMQLQPSCIADQATRIHEHQPDISPTFTNEKGNMMTQSPESAADTSQSSSYEFVLPLPANDPLSVPASPLSLTRQNFLSNLETASVNTSEVATGALQLASNQMLQGTVVQNSRNQSVGSGINQGQVVYNVFQYNMFSNQTGALNLLPDPPASDCVFAICVQQEQIKLCESIDRDCQGKLKEIAKAVGDQNGTIDLKNLTALSLLQVWKVHVHEGKYTWRGFYDILIKLDCQSAAEYLKLACDKACLIRKLSDLKEKISIEGDVIDHLISMDVITSSEYRTIASKSANDKLSYLVVELLVAKPCNSQKVKSFFEALNATGYYGDYIKDFMLCPEDIGK